jgi:hypothetical protein
MPAGEVVSPKGKAIVVLVVLRLLPASPPPATAAIARKSRSVTAPSRVQWAASRGPLLPVVTFARPIATCGATIARIVRVRGGVRAGSKYLTVEGSGG